MKYKKTTIFLSLLVSRFGVTPKEAENLRKLFGANVLACLVLTPFYRLSFGHTVDFAWLSPSPGKLYSVKREGSPLNNWYALMNAATQGNIVEVQKAAKQTETKLEKLARLKIGWHYQGETLSPLQRAEYKSWLPRLRAISQNPQQFVDAIAALRTRSDIKTGIERYRSRKEVGSLEQRWRNFTNPEATLLRSAPPKLARPSRRRRTSPHR